MRNKPILHCCSNNSKIWLSNHKFLDKLQFYWDIHRSCKKTIKLFKENELLKDDVVLEKMYPIYKNKEKHIELCNIWEKLDETVKNQFRNKIYKLLIGYESDETNSGLILWNNVPNEYMVR
jgi:hypothetical protein